MSRRMGPERASRSRPPPPVTQAIVPKSLGSGIVENAAGRQPGDQVPEGVAHEEGAHHLADQPAGSELRHARETDRRQAQLARRCG